MKTYEVLNGTALSAQSESSRLIIEEPPLQVLPSLAVKIGLNEAIVVQQLHYLLRNPRFGRRLAEHQWIFNTYEEWRMGYFPFWSVETIKRVFTSLAKRKLVLCCQPEGRLSRRKYYRLDYAKLNELSEQVKLTSSNGSNCSVPITKTTCKESKESKETSSGDDALDSSDFQPMGKWDDTSKEEKLKRIRRPRDYPSEQEFDSFLVRAETVLPEYRPDLYETLCQRKWHHWDARYGKWVRIRDWKKYVQSLDTMIAC